MYKLAIPLLATATLMACQPPAPKTYTMAQAQAKCENARRDAQGPRTQTTLGVNSRTGLSAGFNLSFNDKFIRGVDPQVAYDNCMQSLNIIDRPTQ